MFLISPTYNASLHLTQLIPILRIRFSSFQVLVHGRKKICTWEHIAALCKWARAFTLKIFSLVLITFSPHQRNSWQEFTQKNWVAILVILLHSNLFTSWAKLSGFRIFSVFLNPLKNFVFYWFCPELNDYLAFYISFN